jgi:hypothetical protein
MPQTLGMALSLVHAIRQVTIGRQVNLLESSDLMTASHVPHVAFLPDES